MFVDAMDEKCGKTITMDGKIFHSANIQQTFRNNYALNTRCRVLFETMEPYRFIIVFKRLDIEFEPLCDDDNLQIFDGNSTSHPTIKGKVRSSPGAIKVRRLTYLSDFWYGKRETCIKRNIFHDLILRFQ